MLFRLIWLLYACNDWLRNSELLGFFMLIMKGKEIEQFSVYYGHKHERRLFQHIYSSDDPKTYSLI